jgi:alpha-glucoside transport system permease protein
MSTVTIPSGAAGAGAAATAVIAEPRARRINQWLRTSPGKVTVWALVFLWTIPTFGLLVSSFRPENKIKATGWWTFFKPGDYQLTIKNYTDVLNAKTSNGDMGKYFLNSIKIVIPGTLLPILIAALAAYAFSWMRFKGRDWLFIVVVGLLVVPLQMALIPLLRLFTTGIHIGSTTVFPAIAGSDSFDFLKSNPVQAWIAHACFAMPLAIFLLKNFISSLPSELIEAARVDGAGHLRIFWKIIIPLSVPALASLAIFQFLWVWNDYLVGYVFAGGNNAPLTVRLVDLAGSRGEDWQRLTAAAFITMVVPLAVFASLQRFFVRGLVTGAVKG